MRGNVVDMAVGVIIAGAFGKIVTSLVNDIFMPVITLLTSGKNVNNLFAVLGDTKGVAYASIDAAKEAARFGIGADRSVNYKCDEAGTALNYEVISEAVCSVRAAQPLSADWKRRIDEDVQKRGR